jgi:hypothetical protein
VVRIGTNILEELACDKPVSGHIRVIRNVNSRSLVVPFPRIVPGSIHTSVVNIVDMNLLYHVLVAVLAIRYLQLLKIPAVHYMSPVTGFYLLRI